MDSHIKYLEELIIAIKGSRLVQTTDTSSSKSVPLLVRSEDTLSVNDDRSVKILKTLLRKLHDDNTLRNDDVFVKIMEALTLLIEYNPYLLTIKMQMDTNGVVNSSKVFGILILIDEFIEVSMVSYNELTRKKALGHMWFLRQRLSLWMKLSNELNGNLLKNTVSDHFIKLFKVFEEQLKTVLISANIDQEILTDNLQEINVILYWFCSGKKLFGNSLTFLDSSLGINSFDFHLQRLVRTILFFFNAVQLPSIDSRKLVDQLFQFVARITEYMLNFSLIQAGQFVKIRSLESYKFCLVSLSKLIPLLMNFDDTNHIIAKSLLRIYFCSIRIQDNNQQSFDSTVTNIFTTYLPLSSWLIHKELANQGLDQLVSNNNEVIAENMTNKSIIIILFDKDRRNASRSKLRYDEMNKLWVNTKISSDEYSELFAPFALEPFPVKCKQLENLRKQILNSFSISQSHETPIMKYLRLLDPGILDKHDNNFDKLLKEISISLQSCVATNNVSKLVTWLRVIGLLTCAEALYAKYSKPETFSLIAFSACDICDRHRLCNYYEQLDNERPTLIIESKVYQILFKVFLSYTSVENVNNSIIAGTLICMKRMLTHYQPSKLITEGSFTAGSSNSLQVSFENDSNYFEVINSSFLSRNRLLRLLSANLLPLLNCTSLYNKNDEHTATLVQYLQHLNTSYLTENLVVSWSQLTLTTTGDIFDTLLLKLIDIFNSPDYTLHNLMAFQIKGLAKTMKKTPYQLLSPILPMLLRQIGKNLIERRRSFQQLTNLLGYSPKTIIEIYQRYIVPYAITQYKSDVFSEIAKIMCSGNIERINESKSRLLEKNSRQIFSVALVKHGFFSLELIEQLFLNCVPSFDRNYISAYLPDYKTLAEFLKLFKNEQSQTSTMSENEKMIICSLRYLVTDFEKDKRHGSKYKNYDDWSPEKEQKFQSKLQDNILGIFQIFSSDIHDVEGRTSYYEKLRVINGISFLIKHASKKAIISALAQISICLQTALQIHEIRFNAFECWHLLVKSLSDEELSTVIDSLVCYILQSWDSFDLKLKNLIDEILNTLISTKLNLILNIKPYVTMALSNAAKVKILAKNGNFARKVSKVRNNTNWIPVFASNLNSTNKYVIRQTLQDIGTFLKRKEIERLDTFYSKNSNDVVLLLSALLDASFKFRSTDIVLSEESARCISMIGIIESNEITTWQEATKINKVYDFHDSVQTIKFLIYLLDEVLVPAFWQSENPSKQLFVALVMQESLKFCGLSSASWDVNRPELYPNEAKLWNKFNTISKTTLYPLLSSLYLAQSWKEYVPLIYPSYNKKEGYTTWIKTLTLDLLKTGTDEEHPLHVFSSLIREDDGSLSKFLLPYIIMDIIIKAEPGSVFETIVSNLNIEFSYIFKISMEGLNRYQADSIKMCYEAIFTVIEYCKKWVTLYKQNYNDTNGTYIIKEENVLKMLNRVHDFLNALSSQQLAEKSLETNSFERSALYLEECYRQTTDHGFKLNNSLLSSLQKTYEEIGDIDSIDGMLKSFSTENLASKIEELQYSDSWKMAKDCYSVLGKFSDKLVDTTKMLKLDYDHQQYSQVLLNLEPITAKNKYPMDKNLIQWFSMGMESANLVGDIGVIRLWIDIIEKLHAISDPDLLLHYNVAKSLFFINLQDHAKTMEYLEKCFKLISVHFITPSKKTTFIKKQNLLMRLHSLYDLQLLSGKENSISFENATSILDFRMKRVGPEFLHNYYLLSSRKAIELCYEKKFVDTDLNETYFKIAKLGRFNSRLDIASESLMNCLEYKGYEAELEFAEILWKQGENDRALKLVREINEKYQNHEQLQSRDRAAILLKYTEWLDLSNYSASAQIIKQYENVLYLDPQWEKPYISMGVYYSRLLERKKAEGYVTSGKLEYKSICYFLMAFEKSTVKVRESLPKVVTFWLDTASACVIEPQGLRKDVLEKTTEDICKHIEQSLKDSPTYIWYSVLTQLLSRMMHSHSTSAQLIMQILLNLAFEYPSHMLWYISVLLNSSSKSKVNRGKHIIEKFTQHSGKSRDFVSLSLDLVTAFTDVCLKETKNTPTRSGKSLEKDFKFPMSIAPNSMVVPVRINLEMVLPLSSESMSFYSPFRPAVTIAKFGSTYKIFSSLKKPKKLNIIGSDGKIYGIMCKKEDVRQDNQYMQFATTMDYMLSKDLESTKRNLGITTYFVLSLREDCGLIEIVPNVVTLRSIFVTKYESMKIKYSLKSLYDQWQKIPDDHKVGFYKDQISKFSPVLYRWFLETFPDPIKWFNARNAYSRSYSVMAMVGFILGLGDRHCENILLDIESGKVLHVDFDCLFEKGKRLPVPEIVPFRMTQNLYDALGITGTEGTFKKSSEVTVSLMRQNEISLVNVIETILYDRNMDYSIQKALKVLRNKIRGVDARDGLLLSVPGQVETLIQESVSDENLSHMYIGWLPFW